MVFRCQYFLLPRKNRWVIVNMHKLISRFLQFRSDDSVYLYQMGKVGSTSIERTIPNAIHFHTLFRNPPCPPWFKSKRSGVHYVNGLMKDFLKYLTIVFRKEIKIITLVRNPLDRNVSMYFQDLPYWYVEYDKAYRVPRDADGMILHEVFEKVFPHLYAIEWFDKEIRRLTGIDIYKYKYDREKGFVKIECGKYKILILEMTLVEQNFDVVQDFYGKKISFVTGNESSGKWYGNLYREFRAFEYPPKLRSEIESSKFYRHFYG